MKKTEEARPTGYVKRYRPVGVAVAVAAPVVAKETKAAEKPKAETKKKTPASPKPKSAKK